MYPSILAQQTRAAALDYLRTTLKLRDAQLEAALFRFLGGDDGLFRGPYLNLRLPYRQAADGAPIPLEISPPYRPYAHQLKSWQRLHSRDEHTPEPTLVTTGTGSGKTECFLYPLLDHCYRHRGQPGIKAIILYPMNALATDQARRVAEELATHPLLSKASKLVTAGLFVGGKGQHGATTKDNLVDKHDILRQSPPDILLTNYKMLDFLLLRPNDAALWRDNTPTTLRYLVLDELHTFDGAQGSDVACLIRRLRDRLDIPPGALTPVGTSATVGASEAGTRALVRFATQVFGTPVGEDAIVREDRYDLEEFLDAPDEDADRPGPGSDRFLDPGTAEDPEEWARLQARMWVGRSYSDPVALGERLRAHPTVRALFQTMGGQLRSWPEVLRGVGKRDPDFRALPGDVQIQALDSLLGLIAAARRRVGAAVVPWVTVQVQLWVRELRRLLRKVPATLDEAPAFAWAGAYEAVNGEHWLPIVHCRECGASGFGALDSEHGGVLSASPSEVGQAWMSRSYRLRCLIPGHETRSELQQQLEFEQQQYLDPAGLTLGYSATRKDGSPRLPVLVEASHGGPRRHYLFKCPVCDAVDAMRIMGARAASLGSVLVSHTFTSPFNSQKKLIAFTDSVQDASHRAGFFSARTYRFNLRTAMLSVLRAKGTLTLDAFGEALVEHWLPRLEQPRLVATFMPTDLFDLSTYVAYRRSRKGPAKRLMRDLTTRLRWEAVREFGLLALVGRSLERSGCAAAYPAKIPFQTACESFHEWVVEDHAHPRTRTLEPGRTRHFLAGLLERLRTRGGVFDPLLDDYIQQKGQRFQLSKRRNLLMSPFGPRSRLPRFLTDRPVGEVFETYVSNPDTQTWYRDWAERALSIPSRQGQIPDIYRAAVRCLKTAGLLCEVPCGKGTAYGLDPAQVMVTHRPQGLTCRQCGAAYAVADAEHWSDQRCPAYRCRGTLEPSKRTEDYYGRLYGSDRLQRVFAAEHTGLLERPTREAVERQFKTQAEPEAPNLLVATPTLEMGIDVGDLSAVMLCSIPPGTANYLQRIGRAGRKTGNALCLTVAEARPHDQYFFAEPEEMMAGEVVPPGCFLDAPEMLKRQMVAHAMDQWARQATQSIPNKVRLLLGAAGEAGFPGAFLEWYGGQQDVLTERFLGLFDETLSPHNRDRLRAYGLDTKAGVASAVTAAFAGVEAERKRLNRLNDRLGDRLKEAEGDSDAERIEELKQSRAMVARLRDDLLGRYPLNVLTDAGVLPNYAFPEPGVKLRSVLRKPAPKPTPNGGDAKPKKKGRYETHEYIRPGRAALRELAPFNTFYAEGRRVQINEVDVGSKARPMVEVWRFCASCHYQARLEDEAVTPADACPSCGHPKWPDTGQVRHMLHFRRALSLDDLVASRTVDDSDERRQVDYQTQRLIHVGPDSWTSALVNPGIPFGFERLRDVILREVNHGPKTLAQGHGTDIAGSTIKQEGFLACMDCGRVKDERRRDDQAFNHAPYCRSLTGKKKENTRRLLLYRQVQSEAIRMLLPVSTVEWDQDRSSFQAALALGLRKRFNGNPGHLLIATVSEPRAEDHATHRRYQMIYDAVPGGSGYLAELSRPDELRQVFQGALDAMRTCRCATQEGKDGCPRCVLAHQPQSDLKSISRKRAMDLVAQVLGGWDEMVPRPTLSQVELDAKLESELEYRFVGALKHAAAKRDDMTVTNTMFDGQLCYLVDIGDAVWRLRPQVWLGPENSTLSESCRVDFLGTCLKSPQGSPRELVIECDGHAFHVEPKKPDARLRDDVRKRSVLMETHRVWTLTWKDVDRFMGDRSAGAPTLFPDHNQDVQHQILSEFKDPKIEPSRRGDDALSGLLDYMAWPVAETWTHQATVLALAGMNMPFPTRAACDAVRSGLEDGPGAFVASTDVQPGPPATLSWHRVGSADGGGWSGIQARATHAQMAAREVDVTLRIFDEHEGRKHDDFHADWRAFFHAWNLLQFIDPEVWTTSDLGVAPADSMERVVLPEDTVQTLLNEEIFPPEFGPLLRALEAAGVDLDTLDGFELTAGTRSLGMLSLAWPEARVAVHTAWEAEVAAEFATQGWTVHPLPADPDALIPTLLTALGGEA